MLRSSSLYVGERLD